MPSLYDCGIALIEYETPLNAYSSLRAERLVIAIINRNYSVNSAIRDKKGTKAKVSFALTGRNPLKSFL